MRIILLPVRNEQGFVLIISMMMLVILTLFGTFATNTSVIELGISGNDRVSKESFYQADGGTEAGIELVEQNFACAAGFKSPGIMNNNDATTFLSIVGIDVFDRRFAYAEKEADVAGAHATSTLTDPDFPSDTIRSLRIPGNPAIRNDIGPHTNIAAYSVRKYAEGSANETAAGYGNKKLGITRVADIVSAHLGRRNSLSKIHLQWTHIIGQEGDCLY